MVIILRYFTEFCRVRDHYAKWLKIHRYFLRYKCSREKSSFQRNIIYGDIRGGHPSEGVKVKRPPSRCRKFDQYQP